LHDNNVTQFTAKHSRCTNATTGYLLAYYYISTFANTNTQYKDIILSNELRSLNKMHTAYIKRILLQLTTEKYFYVTHHQF